MALLRSRRWLSSSSYIFRSNNKKQLQQAEDRNEPDPESGSNDDNDKSSTFKQTQNHFSNITNIHSILLLNLVAILWGSQHVVIKSCVSSSTTLEGNNNNSTNHVASFTLLRFCLATLFAIPFSSWPCCYKTMRWGVELGFWMFLGYSFQAVGLEYTTAQKSGFLLYLNVKFVPLLGFLFYRRAISIPTGLSALAAVLGTMLLLLDGSSDNSSDWSTHFDWNIGDLWSIAAAAASAMFIFRLESASSSVAASTLNVTCLGTVAIASLIWWFLTATSTTSTISSAQEVLMTTLYSNLYELLYLSAITTTLANWIQTKAQRHVTAERASIIYAMDPVWGSMWAHGLLGETLSREGMLGAIIITVAAVINGILDFTTRRIKDESQ